MKTIWISEAGGFDGQEVQIRGWVHQKRSSGKKLRFLVVRDGTGVMQTVLFQGECAEEALVEFETLTQESSVEVTGVLKKEPRSPGGYEMSARQVRRISGAEAYPISPKEHGIEYLMENRHLWIRSSKPWAMLRVRSELEFAIHDFFRDRGFIRFDAPILTPSACEGTSTLFSTQYFEQKAFLTQSGQLYGEVGAMSHGKIYTFGPTFRAEKSKTRKHLTEFWMIEPEVAFNDLKQNMDLAEAFVGHLIGHALQVCSEELKILERAVSKLEKIRKPFPRISYDEAVVLLSKKGQAIEWGEDFGAPHETCIGEEFDGQPVFIHHMPAKIKAFYFKQSNEVFGSTPTQEGRYALGCDLIAPEGYGEIVGGGQREDNAEFLKARILEHGLQLKDYEWYLDLRRYGSVPHAGFGLGLERMIAWVTGAAHLRETIPFPRMIQTLRP